MVLNMPTLFNVFDTSAATGEGIGADVQQKVIIEAGSGIVPIGAIIPWLKSFAGVPTLATQNVGDIFVECNGQLISDPDSPLDGQTLPNLNGSGAATQYFLRGSTTSGTTGGSTTHQHSSPVCFNNATEHIGVDAAGNQFGSAGTLDTCSDTLDKYAYNGTETDNWPNMMTSIEDGQPPYYEVVWLIRIK